MKLSTAAQMIGLGVLVIAYQNCTPFQRLSATGGETTASSLDGSAPAVKSAPTYMTGVYRWGAPDGTGKVDQFEHWLGGQVSLAEDFQAGDSWANSTGNGWQLGPWHWWKIARPDRRVILNIPILPGAWDKSGTSDDPTPKSLAACAAGDYDAHWRQFADNLTSSWGDLGEVYLRVGHEMDGGWYTWRAQQGSGDEQNFAGCFKAIVKAMRAEKPLASFKYVYNPTTLFWSKQYLIDTYPGDDYVDVVGLDIYDQTWALNTYPYPDDCDSTCRTTRQTNAWNAQVWTLDTIRDFAIEHGKPFAIPEWGLVTRSDGHGGGDNPVYMKNMIDFIQNPANKVLFHVYFDVQASDGSHQISTGGNQDYVTPFSASTQMFKAAFGTN